MATLRVIGSKAAALDNIEAYQAVRNPANHGLPAFTRFSQFKDWYFDPVKRQFGPGKFIGYRGTTVANYSGQGNGGVTHKALEKYFDKVPPGSLVYQRLEMQLNILVSAIGKPLSQKFNSSGGIYVPIDSLELIGDEGGAKIDETGEPCIDESGNLSKTEQENLIKARRGQGKFRSGVANIEPCCRVTGLKAYQHLRASHIKPWHACNNIERLDGNNGLFLSPHIDHLFDRGFISFGDNGKLLISSCLHPSVLTAWHVPARLQHSPPFLSKQKKYLDYHRKNVFVP